MVDVFERRVRLTDEGHVVPALAAGPHVGAVELHKAQWLLAVAWRRRAAAACARVGLSFMEWLVIDALRELYQELGDAVSQSAVATAPGLRRGNVSDMMPALERKRLVSRGPSASGVALRLFLTEEAEQLLLLVYPHLDTVSR